MDTTSAARISKMVDDGQLDEAKRLLDEFSGAPLSDEDRGAAYAQYATVYLKVKNAIARQHEASLDEAIAALREINAAEQQAKDKIDLAATRSQLSG